MRHVFALAVVLGALKLVAGTAVAQPVADHLECYKAKDPLKRATYTADIGGVTAEPGCLIKLPAKLTCVPATKENVRPVPPGGGPTGTPNGFNCYSLKCPRTMHPSVPAEDQFGSRTVGVSIAELLCAPFRAADDEHHDHHDEYDDDRAHLRGRRDRLRPAVRRELPVSRSRDEPVLLGRALQQLRPGVRRLQRSSGRSVLLRQRLSGRLRLRWRGGVRLLRTVSGHPPPDMS